MKAPIMDRPATTTPATAREIILEIVRNMREGLEPLHYSTLAPAIYHVYLHPDDMDRLRGIVPRIVEEAARALDAELESLNRASHRRAPENRPPRRAENRSPEGGWQIRILENTDEDVQPGDIAIYSELALPAQAGLRRRFHDQADRHAPHGRHPDQHRSRIPRARPAPAHVPPRFRRRHPNPRPNPARWPSSSMRTAPATSAYQMTKEQIVVGRGGRDYWTDLKLDTLPDVSREHFRLRRDPASGKFFLKDLSRLGTTINGEKAPSSIEFVEGEKRDRNVEAPVPKRRESAWPTCVFLDFRSTSQWLRRMLRMRGRRAIPAGCAATTKTRSTSTPIAAFSW